MNNDDLHSNMSRLKGNPAWQIKRHAGSYIGIDAGSEVTNNYGRVVGSLTLWIYSPWIIYKSEGLVLCANDPQERIDKEFEMLTGKIISDITVDQKLFDIIVEFDSKYWLQTFTSGLDMDYWWLRIWGICTIDSSKGSIIQKQHKGK
ncbi:MAG: hypothetical protein AAFU54_30575 [Chloroflexota bacterium]